MQSDSLPSVNSDLDIQVRAALARMTGGLSPAAGLLAQLDWAAHLAVLPGKRLDLACLAFDQVQRLGGYLGDFMRSYLQPARARAKLPVRDEHFAEADWESWPFNLWHQTFLLSQQWWWAATHGVTGVEKHHEDLVAFGARQWLDMLSPGNLPWANPVVIRKTALESGANLLRGFRYWAEDVDRLARGAPPAGSEQFQPGRDVACTRGKVVLRNRLMELIQYSPTTSSVYQEPVLIVPAWIMKYYILDLSPSNSLVKYLVDQGHTVFCISWKNPRKGDHDLGMDDYLALGFHAALGAVNAICPKGRVHATGYCLGGTLLAIAAAAMARDGDARLASTTYFGVQMDFSEPGELGLFVDESQLSLLEAQMEQAGYLTARQMAAAFSMLRSYDLLWSRLVHRYLLGERTSMNDLMAWNADATRMPAKMHSQYLRRLFLCNDLAEGRYRVGDAPVLLDRMVLPTFAVATLTDHVAPWRSVHKLHRLTSAEVTFVLTTGGHNAGIVNPPDPTSHHSYWMLTRAAGEPYLGPEEWLNTAPMHAGSWWPAWQQWLAEHSGARVRPPHLGADGCLPLADAPGSYVLER